jgi:hypothetical protein
LKKKHTGADNNKKGGNIIMLNIRNFFTFFLNLFFLANFVVGSLLYIFVPGQKSPVPEPHHIAAIGLATGILAGIHLLLEK